MTNGQGTITYSSTTWFSITIQACEPERLRYHLQHIKTQNIEIQQVPLWLDSIHLETSNREWHIMDDGILKSTDVQRMHLHSFISTYRLSFL